MTNSVKKQRISHFIQDFWMYKLSLPEHRNIARLVYNELQTIWQHNQKQKMLKQLYNRTVKIRQILNNSFFTSYYRLRYVKKGRNWTFVRLCYNCLCCISIESQLRLLRNNI